MKYNESTDHKSTYNQPTIKNNIMEANQYFSLPRFWQLLQREFAQNKKIIFLIAAVIVLVIVFNGLGWAYNREYEFNEFAYPFYLLVSGFVLTSLSFTDMNRSDNKLFYLTLPSSTLEKFISRWLITGPGFAILFTLLYWFATSVALSLGITIFDFNIGAFNFFAYEHPLIFQVYLAVQTLFLLGAVYFRKFAIFKTALSTVLFAASLAIISL